MHRRPLFRGKFARKFEEEFAEWLGISHCIGCGNGTDALEIFLQALEIGEGDEVLVPACTWISTAEVVSSSGAQPVFIDMHSDYYTLDVGQVGGSHYPQNQGHYSRSPIWAGGRYGSSNGFGRKARPQGN